MFELLGGLIGGAFSYFGAKDQASASEEQFYYQLLLMQKIGKELQGEYDDVIRKIAADPEGYAGKRVQAADYRPVDITSSQRNSVQGNLRNSDVINQLVRQTNAQTVSNDIRRIETFDPTVTDTLAKLGINANELMNGRLPDDVVDQVVSRRQSLSGSIGTPGGSEAATLKDLGMTSLDAVDRGNNLLQSLLRGVESVTPISRQIAAPQFFISPQEGLQTDLQQAQLIQQSQQNRYNLEAAPDPGKNLMAQLQIQGANASAAMKAGAAGVPQPQFPTAQVYSQIGNSIGNAVASLGNSYGSGGGGYDSGFGNGFNPAAYNAYAQSYNSNLSDGTPPKAYVVY